MLKVTVEEIMTEEVIRIDEDATVRQAAHILLRFQINGVLVTQKNNRNNVVGLVTTRDLLKLLDQAMSIHGHRKPVLDKIARMPVGNISTKNILKVQKNAKIEKIIGIMHKKNLHTIPVYDGDKLVGIVGKHDILNAAFG